MTHTCSCCGGPVETMHCFGDRRCAFHLDDTWGGTGRGDDLLCYGCAASNPPAVYLAGGAGRQRARLRAILGVARLEAECAGFTFVAPATGIHAGVN